MKDFYDEKFSLGSRENCNFSMQKLYISEKCFKTQNLFGIFRKFRDIRVLVAFEIANVLVE